MGYRSDRLGLVVERRVEEGYLVLGIVLRRNPGKTHAIVQGEARCDLPRILRIELQLVVAEIAAWARTGLVKAPEIAEQGTGVGTAGVFAGRAIPAAHF